MNSWIRIVAAIATSLVMSACAWGSELDSATPYEAARDNIYASSNNFWKTRSIPVCWENPTDGDSTQRAWVQESVTATWDAVSSIDFTGWGQCGVGGSGIRIRIEDSQAHTKGLGSALNGKSGGMVLDFTFQNWNQACQGREEYCIRTIAVHEFGHALGFAHEQNRADTPDAKCAAEEQGSDGDFVIGAWDLDSVMNYCNPDYMGEGQLSSTDIDAVRLVYDAGIDGLIANKNNGKCLDIGGGSLEPGVAAISWPCHGGTNQRWDVKALGLGYYSFINRNSGLCLDVFGASQDNGADIGQYTCTGGGNQIWHVESTGGVTRLVAMHSGKCLEVADFSQADGARIQQWDCHSMDNQKWALLKQ